MAATVKGKEILLYRVQIALSSRQNPIYVSVELGAVAKSWHVYLPSKEKFSIQELIDICTAVYDANIFDSDYTYLLGCEDWKDTFYIRGKEKVTENILEQIKIPFCEKKES